MVCFRNKVIYLLNPASHIGHQRLCDLGSIEDAADFLDGLQHGFQIVRIYGKNRNIERLEAVDDFFWVAVLNGNAKIRVQGNDALKIKAHIGTDFGQLGCLGRIITVLGCAF